MCKEPSYSRNRLKKGVTLSELAHWLLKHIIKVIANRSTNPEVMNYSTGIPYGILNGDWVDTSVRNV